MILFFRRLETWAGRHARLLGALVLALYWLSTQPAGRSYTEDFCYETSMRVMAENLEKTGRPDFTTDLYMTHSRAPERTPVPFFSWSIERDWWWSYVWKWNPAFPILWVYFALSLALAYGFVGWVLRQMGFRPSQAWLLALVVTLFHVPRHFKIWHHYEYMAQHWLYLSFFIDALIWHRLVRENRWSLNLEAWRGFFQIAVLGAPGYYWGPTLLEWIIVRACFAAFFLYHRFRKASPVLLIEYRLRSLALPALLTGLWAWMVLLWFPPWLAEMQKLGTVAQWMDWFARFHFVIRPLWLDYFQWLLPWKLPSIDTPETVVTIGWFYWIPALLGLWLVRKRKDGRGMIAVLPFLILLVVALLYMSKGRMGHNIHVATHFIAPFMKFFRVASRWGQFLPQIVFILVILAWPELSRWFRAHAPKLRTPALVFLAFSLLEMTWLLKPVTGLPALDPSTATLLADLRNAPGDTVLDLPFCVAGGNGVCTEAQCPNYPRSMVAACFGNWHGKKAYGLFQARLVQSQCSYYDEAPFTSWFNAWRQQRCLTPPEWKDFCGYLDRYSDLSAVLVYPTIWTGAGSPECRAEFAAHLGPPVQSGKFYLEAPKRDAQGRLPPPGDELLRYAPKCRNASSNTPPKSS
ncbi:MAG: hypothetical protein AB7F66_02285 [Bacteriovoracia bacterium]